MNPDLMTLLELQDLKSKLRELQSGSDEVGMETEHFDLDVAGAIEHLREKITELEGELSAPLRRRYGRVKETRERVVVPVIGGVCYGCFVSIPTATTGESTDVVRNCEHCGRFIYVLS